MSYAPDPWNDEGDFLASLAFFVIFVAFMLFLSAVGGTEVVL